MEREPKFKLDLQGLLRTGVMLITLIGGYYQIISTINEKVNDNKRAIAIIRTEVERHEKNTRIYTMDELSDKFVLRKEWESNNKYLREDVKYIRDKMDLIVNKLADSKKF